MKVIDSIRKFVAQIIAIILLFYVVIAAVPALLIFLVGIIVAPEKQDGLSKEEMSKRLKELTAKLKSELPNVKDIKVTRN